MMEMLEAYDVFQQLIQDHQVDLLNSDTKNVEQLLKGLYTEM